MYSYSTLSRALVTAIAALALAGCIPNSGGGGNNGGGNNGGLEFDSGGGDAGSEDTASGEDSRSNLPDAEVDATGDDSGGGGGGAQGLQGYCEYYKECGGTYYADAEECVQESIGYWGECRQPELDAFGDCMMGLTCEEWGNPDAYNPSGTECGDEWQALNDAGRCD